MSDETREYLTHNRLAEMLGGKLTLMLLERWAGKQLPTLSPERKQIMQRNNDIRQRLSNGESAADIARDLRMDPSYVSRIGKIPD